MPRAKTAPDVPVYQIKVTLGYSRPPIWRRLLVRGDTPFDKLHWILQVAMGWTNSHLHQFIVGRPPDLKYIGRAYDGGDELGTVDERTVKLNEIVTGAKFRFFYEYDFGDGWEHELLVEKTLQPEAGARYPVCFADARACPPEDVGGIYGYYEFLEAIKDPDHPEHEDLLEWAGGDFDPQAFDLEAANRALRRLK
jgi:hypothetical protein